MDTGAYLAIEYQDKARGDKQADCWGLIWLIYQRELGIALPRHDSVSLHTTRIDDLDAYIVAQTRDFEAVDTPRAYDLIMLYQGRHPTHIGCAVNAHDMIHIQAGANVVIEPVRGKRWAQLIYGIYRHRDMA